MKIKHREWHKSKIKYLVKEGARLPQMNAVHIPEAIREREADVRKTLLTEFNLEIGAGLGPLAGKIWRVGIMGYSCKPENVMLCLSALGSVLSDMGLPIHVGDAEAAARDAEAARAQPVAQVGDRARAERHVDERVELEDLLALRLGVAAADGDDAARVAVLQRLGVAEVGREPGVRLLANRAGVEDEDVGVVLGRRLAQAELLEQPLDPLRVVSVHLAAEGADVVSKQRMIPLCRTSRRMVAP